MKHPNTCLSIKVLYKQMVTDFKGFCGRKTTVDHTKELECESSSQHPVSTEGDVCPVTFLLEQFFVGKIFASNFSCGVIFLKILACLPLGMPFMLSKFQENPLKSF